jgi:hypothetical protein
MENLSRIILICLAIVNLKKKNLITGHDILPAPSSPLCLFAADPTTVFSAAPATGFHFRSIHQV